MKIELRNFKSSEAASDETLFFSADIWIDGQKEGHASNGGQGGMTMISPRALEQRLDAYAATLPRVSFDGAPTSIDDELSAVRGCPQDADYLISQLAADQHDLKRYRRVLRSALIWPEGSGKLREVRLRGAKFSMDHPLIMKKRDELRAQQIVPLNEMDDAALLATLRGSSAAG